MQNSISTALLGSLALLFAVWAPAAAAESETRMAEKHATFFQQYCIRCHGPQEANAKLRLDEIPFDLSQDIQSADLWQKILSALNSGEMPPEDETQPTNDEKAAFLEELSEKLVAARNRLSDAGSTIVMRRLNRREYRNTIRDLLGVTIDVSELPADQGAGGFDTVGTSLFFSPDQFELYLKLARRALDEAILRETEPQPEPPTVRIEVETAANDSAEETIAKLRDGLNQYEAWLAADGKRPPTDFGFLDEPRARRAKKLYEKNSPYYFAYREWPKIGEGVYFHQLHSSIDAGLSDALPPGDYLVRICIGAVENAPANRCFIDFGELVDVGGRSEFVLRSSHQITAGMQRPQVLEVPLTLTRAGGRSFCFREMRPHYDMGNWKKDGKVPPPTLWVDWIEVEGSLVRPTPPEAQRQIFFAAAHRTKDQTYAREIMICFAQRAFRGRTAETDYLDRLVGIYQQQREAGASFETAIGESLAVVLASPDFLYLSEAANHSEQASGPLTDLELATRLSYFLWSAPPDEELLIAARSRSLSKPDELRAQVERMLDDPKSWEFVRGFCHQWLDLDRIDLFQFNRELYPDFNESMKLAAVEEVYQFFGTLLGENQTARHLLKSDFVIVNGLLAEYYGIPGVSGDLWRKVPAPEHRGGLVAMAVTLAMGSDGERTSPVERGAFVLRKLLNDPPPPAPANVPQLSRLDEHTLTTRERLRMHQEQAQCMHCHRKIDPIGLGLENFDAAGKWRTEEPVISVSFTKKGARKTSRGKAQPIDASGRLHNGPAFENFQQLSDILASCSDNFSRGMVENLLEYGLGRRVGFSDHEQIEQLHANWEQDDLRLRSLIHLIVLSPAFRTK